MYTVETCRFKRREYDEYEYGICMNDGNKIFDAQGREVEDIYDWERSAFESPEGQEFRVTSVEGKLCLSLVPKENKRTHQMESFVKSSDSKLISTIEGPKRHLMNNNSTKSGVKDIIGGEPIKVLESVDSLQIGTGEEASDTSVKLFILSVEGLVQGRARQILLKRGRESVILTPEFKDEFWPINENLEVIVRDAVINDYAVSFIKFDYVDEFIHHFGRVANLKTEDLIVAGRKTDTLYTPVIIKNKNSYEVSVDYPNGVLWDIVKSWGN